MNFILHLFARSDYPRTDRGCVFKTSFSRLIKCVDEHSGKLEFISDALVFKVKTMEIFLVVLYFMIFLAFYQGLGFDEDRFEQEDSGEFSE